MFNLKEVCSSLLLFLANTVIVCSPIGMLFPFLADIVPVVGSIFRSLNWAPRLTNEYVTSPPIILLTGCSKAVAWMIFSHYN